MYHEIDLYTTPAEVLYNLQTKEIQVSSGQKLAYFDQLNLFNINRIGYILYMRTIRLDYLLKTFNIFSLHQEIGQWYKNVIYPFVEIF